jgi:inorganic pyrophosphatase
MTNKPLLKAHPWHGINQPQDFPETVNAFVEIVPGDTVKFEIDKVSGYLKIDRPQKYSNYIPALYGFIPKTYCSGNVALFASNKMPSAVLEGDKDPLDICIITERNITSGNIIAPCIPIGGFRLIDKNEVDDKIIAVLKGDAVYGEISDISELPLNLVERLNHYFLTYKNLPGYPSQVVIESVYGKQEAMQVIRASVHDYETM